MSHNLSQPEEIDMVMMEMEEGDANVGVPVTDKAHLNGGAQQGWRAGYVPPYRAAVVRERN